MKYQNAQKKLPKKNCCSIYSSMFKGAIYIFRFARRIRNDGARAPVTSRCCMNVIKKSSKSTPQACLPSSLQSTII